MSIKESFQNYIKDRRGRYCGYIPVLLISLIKHTQKQLNSENPQIHIWISMDDLTEDFYYFYYQRKQKNIIIETPSNSVVIKHIMQENKSAIKSLLKSNPCNTLVKHQFLTYQTDKKKAISFSSSLIQELTSDDLNEFLRQLNQELREHFQEFTVEERAKRIIDINQNQNIDTNDFDESCIFKDDKELYTVLESIKSSYGEVENIPPRKRRKRSQMLVKALKNAYQFKCQLCYKEEMIPVIEKLNGTYYVEMHHIDSLSTEMINGNLSINSEECNLDTQDNAIIVCPYHHKVLHFLHGGNFKQRFNPKGYVELFNSKGDILKVHQDKHLYQKYIK